MSTPVVILLPTDDSPSAHRAARHVIHLSEHGLPVEVHLLNVQPALRGVAPMLIARAELNDYHRDEGMRALANTRQELEKAGITVHPHVGVGSPGDEILAFAKELRCDQIIMGTRGLGSIASLVLGSVASKVVGESDLPVTVLR